MSSMAPISYSFNRYPNNNGNSNSTSNNNRAPELPETNEDEPACEFTNPCTTTSSPTKNPTSKNGTGKHPRKVISHIFGRNKAITKLVPVSVWAHYCRKHYQRARYRSTQWPFTQAELLLDSVGRMERWGGVKGFEVALRRREVERVDGAEDGHGGGSGGGSGGGRTGTRKSARVRAAKDQGQGEGDGDDEDTMSASGSSNDNDHDDNPSSDNTPRRRSTSSKTKNKAKGRRKKPNIESAPVPDWLRQEVGPNKSFEDIRGIINRLLEYLTVLREEGRKEKVRFPDIEILPEFQEWVFEMERVRVREKRARAAAAGGRKGQVKKGAKRVSKRGAVQKV